MTRVTSQGIAATLFNIAALLRGRQDSPYRIRAYERGARVLRLWAPRPSARHSGPSRRCSAMGGCSAVGMWKCPRTLPRRRSGGWWRALLGDALLILSPRQVAPLPSAQARILSPRQVATLPSEGRGGERGFDLFPRTYRDRRAFGQEGHTPHDTPFPPRGGSARSDGERIRSPRGGAVGCSCSALAPRRGSEEHHVTFTATHVSGAGRGPGAKASTSACRRAIKSVGAASAFETTNSRRRSGPYSSPPSPLAVVTPSE